MLPSSSSWDTISDLSELQLQDNGEMRYPESQTLCRVSSQSNVSKVETKKPFSSVAVRSNVLNQFEKLLEPVFGMKSLLVSIQRCGALHRNNISRETSKELKSIISHISTRCNRFDQQIKYFDKALLYANKIHPETFRACSRYLIKLDNLMSSTELMSMRSHFPRAIDDKDLESIEVYMELTNKLSAEFSEALMMKNDMKIQLETLPLKDLSILALDVPRIPAVTLPPVFPEIDQKVQQLLEILLKISTLCNPIIGEPSVNPGAHENDTKKLSDGKTQLLEHISRFYEIDVANGDRFTNVHSDFVIKIRMTLQGKEFSTLCCLLSNVVDREDQEQIRRYGRLAKETMDSIEDSVVELNKERVRINRDVRELPEKLQCARAAFGHLDKAIRRGHAVGRYLDEIKAKCILLNGEVARVNIDDLQASVNNVRTQIECFIESYGTFNDFANTANRMDPELFKECLKLINRLSHLIHDNTITSICNHLPTEIRNENKFAIKDYGNHLKTLRTEFYLLKESMMEEMIELQVKFVIERAFNAD